ncbi:basal cell adhesion molecule isoform X2 [Lepisosteus oculatus]|uniref:basal cell adhesion molecule isoform X2 n=1 Tax=Lepisosteus oculatus TaxID=7918 RepID=UPI00372133B7
MDAFRGLGRAVPLCAWLLWALHGCQCSVTVTVPPEHEALLKSSISLPCSYTTTEKPNNVLVEWFIDEGGARKRVAYHTESGSGTDLDTPVSGRVSLGKDLSLNLREVQISDERPYHCQVTAGATGSAEGTVQLKLFAAPERPEVKESGRIISVTEKTTSEVGSCVSRNGNPTPRLIWYKDSTPLPEITDINDNMYMRSSVVKESSGLYTVSNSLYLKPVKEDKDSKFHCRVEYSMPGKSVQHKDSDSFTLSLHYYTEEVTFDLVNSAPIKEGDDVTMKCEADGNPAPDFEFSKKTSNDRIILVGSDGVFTLKSVSRDDGGVYVCEAVDFDSPDSVQLMKELLLTVHYLDPLTVSPSDTRLVPLGGDVELTCTTQGSDTHSLQWSKGADVLSQSGVLSLEGVTYEDAGVYSCLGTVPSVPGLQRETNVSVIVTGRPEIDSALDGVVVKEGDLVTLTCSAQGYPMPNITWTPSGKKFVSNSVNRITSTVTLTVTSKILQSGVTCEATNVHGTNTKMLRVMIGKDTSTASPAHPSGAGKQQSGSSGVVVAIVVCVLLLLLLVALLYCLQRKGKLPCGRQEKKEVLNAETNTNDIVVEMKSDKANEEAGLLEPSGRRPTAAQ